MKRERLTDIRLVQILRKGNDWWWISKMQLDWLHNDLNNDIFGDDLKTDLSTKLINLFSLGGPPNLPVDFLPYLLAATAVLQHPSMSSAGSLPTQNRPFWVCRTFDDRPFPRAARPASTLWSSVLFSLETECFKLAEPDDLMTHVANYKQPFRARKPSVSGCLTAVCSLIGGTLFALQDPSQSLTSPLTKRTKR